VLKGTLGPKRGRRERLKKMAEREATRFVIKSRRIRCAAHKWQKGEIETYVQNIKGRDRL
jgi:hypothetical protein